MVRDPLEGTTYTLFVTTILDGLYEDVTQVERGQGGKRYQRDLQVQAEMKNSIKRKGGEIKGSFTRTGVKNDFLA